MKNFLEIEKPKQKEAVFIGLGPSVNEFDLKKIDREKYSLISMNYWYPYGPQKFGFDVDYYINADRVVFERDYIDFIRYCKTRDDYNVYLYMDDKDIDNKLSCYENTSPLEWIKKHGKAENVIIRSDNWQFADIDCYTAYWRNLEKNVLYKCDLEFDRMIFNSRFFNGFNSFILPFIQYMNFEKLYLLGCDFSGGYFFLNINHFDSQPKNYSKTAFIELENVRKLLSYDIYEIEVKTEHYFFNKFPKAEFEVLI